MSTTNNSFMTMTPYTNVKLQNIKKKVATKSMYRFSIILLFLLAYNIDFFFFIHGLNKCLCGF